MMPTNQMKGAPKDTVSCKGRTFSLLYSPEQIHHINKTLAHEINNYYGAIFKDDPSAKVVAVCVLKGAFIFFADLVRLFDFQCEVDFLRVSSYEGTHAGKQKMAIPVEPKRYQGKYVLIVEDIYDTGATLKYLHGCLSEATDKRIDTVVLIKRKEVAPQIDLKFVGMECSRFVVGYGLDLDEEGRNLGGIYEIVEN